MEPDSAHRGQTWVERDRKRKSLLHWLTSALFSAPLVPLICGRVHTKPQKVHEPSQCLPFRLKSTRSPFLDLRAWGLQPYLLGAQSGQ